MSCRETDRPSSKEVYRHEVRALARRYRLVGCFGGCAAGTQARLLRLSGIAAEYTRGIRIQERISKYGSLAEWDGSLQAWGTGIGGGGWFSRNEVCVDALYQRATYYRRPSSGRLSTATAGLYPCRLWRHRFSIHRIDLPDSGLLGSNRPRWQWSPDVCNSGREDRRGPEAAVALDHRTFYFRPLVVPLIFARKPTH